LYVYCVFRRENIDGGVVMLVFLVLD
jgi:hypothetical protein